MNSRSVFYSIGQLDQLRELASGASLEIVQLGTGTMSGVLANAELGQTSIHMNHFSLPARGRGSLSADRWTYVVFPPGVEGQFNSQSLDSEIMLVYPTGTEFEGTIAGRFHDWIFTVEFDLLAQVCEAQQPGIRFNPRRSVHALRPDPRHMASLRDFAQRSLNLVEPAPQILQDVQTRLSLESELLDHLSRAIVSHARSSRSLREQNRVPYHGIVRQVEDLMHKEVDPTVTLAQLCQATSASERTLRRAFQNVVGVGPNAYLRTLRLNRVRCELETALLGKTTITSVATRWGFSHLGRFSVEYKRFFGETPTETLRRSPATVSSSRDKHSEEIGSLGALFE